MFNYKIWRAENDKFALQRYCLGILAKRGWRVGGGEGGSDSRVGKADAAFLLFFVAKKTPVNQSMLTDWLETKSAGRLPIIVIVADDAAFAMAAAARERGIRMLHYKNLDRLEGYSALPEPPRAGKVAAAHPPSQAPSADRQDDPGPAAPAAPPQADDAPSLQSLRDIARAHVAKADWPNALASWTMVQTAFPREMSGYLGSAFALRQMRRFAEAEELLLEAQKKFPLQQQPSIDLATLAFETRAFDTALERWKTVRERFPNAPSGWIGVARVLKELRRFSEAESAIQTAITRFPSEHQAYLEYAWLPQRQNNWDESASRFAMLRAKFPDFETGYSAGSLPLRVLKRFAAADELLLDAMKRFPNFQQAAIDYAKVAEEQANHADAALRWQAFQAKFPDRPIGYVGAARALENLGRLAEAEQLLEAALARFPADQTALAGKARLADRRSRPTPIPQAAPPATQIPISPAVPQVAKPAHKAGADQNPAPSPPAKIDSAKAEQALAELKALQANARDSALKGAWQAALADWSVVRKAYPDDLSGYIGCAQALRRLGRFEHAEGHLRTAAGRFPNHADPLVDLARIAMERKDHALALSRWQLVTKEHPWHVSGWVGVATALRELERLPEAETAGRLALEQFPQKIEPYAELARIAQAKADWQEAARFWALIREKFPDFESAYTSCCWPLRCLKKYDEAAAIVTAAMRLFPANSLAAIEYARIAQDQDDWTEALQRWRHVRDNFPENPVGHAGLAAALERVGHFDEAERETAAALQLFPNDEACMVVFARLAAARSDWVEAQKRWKQVLDRYPNSPQARLGYGKTRVLAELETAMGASSPRPASNDPPAAVISPVSLTPDAVLARFESLGGNCEFGLVQRQFGLEPLGLLRWTGIAPKMLAAALAAGFDGVGAPENTVLKTINGEWVSSDKRWNLVMHSFIPEKQSPYDVLYPKICRRLQFLKSKLIEDLRAAEKIFVYQHPAGVTDAEITLIAEQLRTFGDPALLCVRLAAGQHKPGSVEQINDRLYLGYIDRLGPAEVPGLAPDWRKISFDIWVDLCRSVMMRHTGTTGMATASAAG